MLHVVSMSLSLDCAVIFATAAINASKLDAIIVFLNTTYVRWVDRSNIGVRGSVWEICNNHFDIELTNDAVST